MLMLVTYDVNTSSPAGQKRLRKVDQLAGVFGHFFSALAAHCVNCGIDGSAERRTLSGMYNRID